MNNYYVKLAITVLAAGAGLLFLYNFMSKNLVKDVVSGATGGSSSLSLSSVGKNSSSGYTNSTAQIIDSVGTGGGALASGIAEVVNAFKGNKAESEIANA